MKPTSEHDPIPTVHHIKPPNVPSCSVRLTFFSSSSASASSSSFCERSPSAKLTCFSEFDASLASSSSSPFSVVVIVVGAADGSRSAESSPSVVDPAVLSALGAGEWNPRAVPVAYAENGFADERAGDGCRTGEPLRWLNRDCGGGDFGRLAAVANGDEDDAKASKPERLSPLVWGVGELGVIPGREDAASLVGAGLTDMGVAVLVEAVGPACVHVLDAKRLGPLTEAKGELVEAYDMNPP